MLRKGAFAFDDLDAEDMAVLMSHVNSNPRASLGGLAPLQMLKAVHGEEDAAALMAALGIEEVPRGRLVLRPEALDAARTGRGMPPVERAK